MGAAIDFGPDVAWKPATVEEADEIADFVVGCLREAFTKDFKLGPQEQLKSVEFNNAYRVYRRKSISNPNNLCRILRRSTETNDGKILGYVELGPKIEFKGVDGCDFEIICLFCDSSYKGRGIGTKMVSSIFNEMADLGRLHVGQHSVGVMTMAGNPHIRFYHKIGASKQSDHELKWIGGTAVTATALLFEPKQVEALVRYADKQ